MLFENQKANYLQLKRNGTTKIAKKYISCKKSCIKIMLLKIKKAQELTCAFNLNLF
ncbi:hypothetical protein FLGSB24_00980 [Flavobacterium sp. GSB-24]|jgi:hypothetical protein|nr:hypothetical protein FLGSB24_00980 [Flavobacterium sp. GSB-24]